jgi:hypothetical protein
MGVCIKHLDTDVMRYHLKLWMGFPDESAAYLPA